MAFGSCIHVRKHCIYTHNEVSYEIAVDEKRDKRICNMKEIWLYVNRCCFLCRWRKELVAKEFSAKKKDFFCQTNKFTRKINF